MGSNLRVADRPRLRSQCENGIRPCPWAGCRFHLLELRERGNGALEADGLALAIDADPSSVEEFTEAAADAVLRMRESCTLDVAGGAGELAADVAEALGVTRQRVNKIEGPLLRRLRSRPTFRDLR